MGTTFYIHILLFFVEDKTFIIVFSILIHCFRYLRPPFILGSKGFVIPNIILGAFIYRMLRPQFSKSFTNGFSYCRCIPNINSHYFLLRKYIVLFLLSHLKRSKFVEVILVENLNINCYLLFIYVLPWKI